MREEPKDTFKLFGFSAVLILLSAVLWVLFLFFIGIV
jgi:hypothetical protein